ncbi:diacylglycerol kinase family protein [Nitrosomonas sp. Nm166]|uniref:diacylglycerol/lipid kinase family protein n=1 Tax=Nitrosomonas sp. Nm166 TaxID=1881054 RepID=UPI0008EEED80|nr:diacylglycerol kinase family protein [Nitrosomonas sp. Nm166]SFF18134.1 diacylglycerol kinase (ATP) [Nitrosomonas sp. Nm166]
MNDNLLFQSHQLIIKIPSPQNILIIYNPISSAGNTETLACKLEMELSFHGKSVVVRTSEKKMKGYTRIRDDIAASDLVVVIGGDGTIRKLLNSINKTDTPIYAIPGGNESLFARSYEMSTSSDDLLEAIASGTCLQQFYGLISGQGIQGEKPFFHMASMGLDSLTVKNIGKRKGPLNDSVYIWHGLKALCSLHHPTVSVRVDGEPVIDRGSGYLIVANNSAYARNLQLVPTANPSRNELVLGFLPGAQYQHELVKAMKILQRKPANLPMQYFSGKSIACTLHNQSYPLQVDGDYFRNRDIESESTVEFSISPRPIRVLIPPSLNNGILQVAHD